MKIDEIRALLEKYQQGLCTDEERKAIDEWYGTLQLGEEASLDEAELNSSLARVRGALGEITGKAAMQTEWGGPAVPTIDPGSRNETRYRIGWRRAAAIAAAVILIGGVTWLFH